MEPFDVTQTHAGKTNCVKYSQFWQFCN